MPRSGNGTFDISTSGYPFVTGSTISSSVVNSILNDLASEMTNSIAKDGQTVVTGSLDMNGQKVILDVDGDTSLHADTDDELDIEVGGVDAMTLTPTGFSLVDNKNSPVMDAVGLITSATSVVGRGIASVSANGTGDWTVTFDNAADSTDEQAVVAHSDGSSPWQCTTQNLSTTTVRVRQWLNSGGSIAAFNHFPIVIHRALFT